MIKSYWKTSLLALALAATGTGKTLAQSEAAEFIKGGVQDAGTLLGAYVQPFGESFGVNMNSGWVHTAAPLKPGRFELRIIANATFVPVGNRTYNLDALGFKKPVSRALYGETATEQWEYTNPVAPTIFGSVDETVSIRKTLTYTNPSTGQQETETLASLSLPQGIGIGVNPLPVIPQLSVGLPLGSEIMVRFLPAVSIGSGDNAFTFDGLWGVGAKHSIKQWIPGIKSLPFNLSVAMGYTSSKSSLGFESLTPEAPAGAQFADPDLAGTSYQGPSVEETDYIKQGLILHTTAWNTSVLISKKMSVLSAFGGLRYARSATNVTLSGIYGVAGEPYINANNPADPNNNRYTLINTEKDPIDIDMPIGQLGLTGGFRLKLGFISFFGEGTWSRYSTISAGMGFGWMN